MSMKLLHFSTSLILIHASLVLYAQELNCNVTVDASQVRTTEQQIFEEMEKAFEQFLNTRKWTDDVFQPEERIKCNINITLTNPSTIGNYRANVQVQSARPVYNTSYESIVLNFADRDWHFEYVEYQPLEFNENSYISNLTSMLAFYAYIIIGMDYDTFSDKGGEDYYEIAQTIVSNAQQVGRPGWSSLESNRNRYWLMENLTNSQMEPVREGLHKYHRLGLDIFESDQDKARTVILEVLGSINKVKDIYPNSILIIAFFDAKHSELINIFSSGSLDVRREAYNLLVELNPSEQDEYQQIIQ